MSANKTKLVIFDFDGTLTKPHKLDNSWTRIWNKIGLTSEEERLYYNAFKKGKLFKILHLAPDEILKEKIRAVLEK